MGHTPPPRRDPVGDWLTTWIRWQMEPWYRAPEVIGGILIFAETIDQQIEYEQSLAEAKDRAEAANRAKSEFLANMSHAIRTPMTSIMGYADMLNQAATDREEWRTWTTQIRRNADHLLMLLNDLLDLSKIEAGRIDIETQVCNLQEILDSVSSVMYPQALAKRLRFAVIADPALPRDLRTDPTRLRQILYNLSSNAVKYTDSGSVTVWVDRLTPTGQDGVPTLSIAVQDTGIGIAADRQEAIFEAFTPAADPQHPRGGQRPGTGGLPAACRLDGRADPRGGQHLYPGAATPLGGRRTSERGRATPRRDTRTPVARGASHPVG